MNKKIKGVLASSIVLSLIFSISLERVAYANINRENNSDRYSISEKIVDMGWNSANTVIIASGEDGNLVDSLTVAPLSKKLDAPVILTKPGKSLPESIMSKIKKLGATRVYIATGSGVLTDDVITQLKNAGVPEVERLGGTTRFDTSLNIAKKMGSFDKVVIASGNDGNLVDSLSIASIAAIKGMPVLLSSTDKIDDAVSNHIKSMNITNSYVMGGPTIVSNNVLYSLPGQQKRLFGANRYSTNSEVLKEFKLDADVKYDKLYVTSGANNNLVFPLACAPLAAKNYAPILLADDEVYIDAKNLLKDKITLSTDVQVVGSEAMVKNEVVNTLKDVQTSSILQVGSACIQTNNTIKVVLTKTPDTVPVISDFKVRIKAQSASEQEVYPSDVKKDTTDTSGKTFILTLNKNNYVDKQEILYSISFKDTGFRNTEKTIAKADFTINSAEVLNLKQIQINFTRELDKASAENVSNYLVYDNGSNNAFPGKYKATLQNDKRTVLLTLDPNNTSALTRLSKTKLVVKKDIKDSTGTALGVDFIKTDLAATDNIRPTVITVEQVALNKIRVTFSEPVKDLDTGLTCGPNNFLIDNGAYIASAVKFDIEKRTAEITLNGSLVKGTSHTLIVNPYPTSDLADFDGNKVEKTDNLTFTTVDDNVAPTVNVKNVSQTSVTYIFSKPINNAKNSNVAYRHTTDGYSYQVLGSSSNVTVNEDRTEVTVNFGAERKMIALGNALIYVNYINKSAASPMIMDDFNNKLEPVSLSTFVVEDTTSPTAEVKVSENNGRQIDVIYSKPVSNGTISSNYALKDAYGNNVGFSITSVGNNTYRITAYKPLSGYYTLTIKGIKDNAVKPNNIDEVMIPVNVTDTIPPTVVNESGNGAGVNNYYLQGDGRNIRIYFSEVMNAADLVNLSMYQNVGNNYASPISAQPSSDGKSVHLTFANSVIGNVNVGQLSDMAGNKVQALATILTPIQGSNPGLNSTVGNKVAAVDVNNVKIYVNDILINVSASDFEINRDGSSTWIPASNITTEVVEGKTVINLIINSSYPISKSQWDVGIAPQIRTISSRGIQGPASSTCTSYGAKLNIPTTAVMDNIPPRFADYNAIEKLDVDRNGLIDHIRVRFSEKMNMNYVSADKFNVAGYIVTDAFTSSTQPTSANARDGATVNNSTDVYIKVVEQQGNYNYGTPEIIIGQGLVDLNGNPFN